MEWENRSAFVYIKTYPGKAEEVYEKVQKDPRTLGAFMTTGGWDLLCWIDTHNMSDVYNWIQQIRTWPQVERTSSCPTYCGYWNEKPYQNKRYYAWLKVRANNVTSPYQYLKSTAGVTFACNVPGDYDCFALYGYDEFDTCYEQVKQLRAQGCEVEFTTPFKAYWNPQCDTKWHEFEKTACQPNCR